MGSWTITGSFDTANWDLYKAMVKSHSSNHHPFLSMTVSPDEKNSSTYIIGVSEIWATSWENQFMSYANNKGADQTAHLRSLISAFVVCCLYSKIPLALLAIAEIGGGKNNCVEKYPCQL